MNKDLTFNQFREAVRQIEQYAKEQGIKTPRALPVDERKMLGLQWQEGLKAHNIVVKVSKEPTYEGIFNENKVENVYIKVVIGKTTEKGAAIVYWCQIDVEEYECNKGPKDYLHDKEDKQEKSISELMQDIIGNTTLDKIMADCIIINKKDIEQLKKDVKALRKENAKLKEIVNATRKE